MNNGTWVRAEILRSWAPRGVLPEGVPRAKIHFTKQLGRWAKEGTLEDTLGKEANLEMAVLFVSLFIKTIESIFFLVAATPGFAHQLQFTFGRGYEVNNLFYFLLCDWKTSWTLLYKAIDENERKKFDEIVKVRKYLN